MVFPAGAAFLGRNLVNTPIFFCSCSFRRIKVRSYVLELDNGKVMVE